MVQWRSPDDEGPGGLILPASRQEKDDEGDAAGVLPGNQPELRDSTRHWLSQRFQQRLFSFFDWSHNS
jgi:hypothetical protein